MIMIYVGYPCIGKTSASGLEGFIDLESSLFNDKSENWADKYIAVAEDLSSQGYKVFISSHKVVRDTLKAKGIPFICIFPSLALKDDGFYRLADRYKLDSTDKNLRAMSRGPHFEEDIKDLMKENMILVIREPKYDLRHTIQTTPVQDSCNIVSINTPSIVGDARSGKVIEDVGDSTDILENPSS